MKHSRVLIVGTGLAGYSTARELRKLDKEVGITMLTADDGRYYSKPMLSNAFTSGKTADDIAIGSADQLAAELGADIRTGIEITAIDREQQRVHAGSTSFHYDSLVLALGADPIVPPIGGLAAGNVFNINDLRDYARFRLGIATAKHILIIGAGLIGVEFANDLRKGNFDVEVVDPAPYPLARLVPEPAGLALQAGLTDIGVKWKFGTTATYINATPNGMEVHFADGDTRITHAILSAIGLRPRIELARACGLKVNRGIQVNQWLASNDSTIFALGDCAEINGLVLPYVMPIMHAARALAKTLAGQPTSVTFPAMPVVVKTTSYPVVVAPAAIGQQGTWTIDKLPEETGIRALYKNAANELLGFTLTGAAVQERNALTKLLPPVL